MDGMQLRARRRRKQRQRRTLPNSESVGHCRAERFESFKPTSFFPFKRHRKVRRLLVLGAPFLPL